MPSVTTSSSLTNISSRTPSSVATIGISTFIDSGTRRGQDLPDTAGDFRFDVNDGQCRDSRCVGYEFGVLGRSSSGIVRGGRSDFGAYIITARRITSGDSLKYRKGFCIPGWLRNATPRLKPICSDKADQIQPFLKRLDVQIGEFSGNAFANSGFHDFPRT